MPSGRISQPFGDGEHVFRLTIEGLEELQDKCDAGPEVVLNRIYAGQWRVADLRETIRLGLIGGGMEPIRALALRNRYVVDGALLDHKPLAANILSAALVGSPTDDEWDDDAGETPGETNPSPEASGGSDDSISGAGS